MQQTECISHSHSRWNEEYGEEESWIGNRGGEKDEERDERERKRVKL